MHSDVEDSFDQGEFPYQTFVSKQNALSMPRSGYKWRSKRRGIVDECCRQSCTVSELRQYCGTEDDWTVERTPCDWTQSRLKQPNNLMFLFIISFYMEIKSNQILKHKYWIICDVPFCRSASKRKEKIWMPLQYLVS